MKKLSPCVGTVLKKKKVSSPLSDRMENLGITEGEKIYIMGYAPCGDPVVIKCRGVSFAVRKSDLLSITEKYENSHNREPKLWKNDTL